MSFYIKIFKLILLLGFSISAGDLVVSYNKELCDKEGDATLCTYEFPRININFQGELLLQFYCKGSDGLEPIQLGYHKSYQVSRLDGYVFDWQAQLAYIARLINTEEDYTTFESQIWRRLSEIQQFQLLILLQPKTMKMVKYSNLNQVFQGKYRQFERAARANMWNKLTINPGFKLRKECAAELKEKKESCKKEDLEYVARHKGLNHLTKIPCKIQLGKGGNTQNVEATTEIMELHILTTEFFQPDEFQKIRSIAEKYPDNEGVMLKRLGRKMPQTQNEELVQTDDEELIFIVNPQGFQMVVKDFGAIAPAPIVTDVKPQPQEETPKQDSEKVLPAFQEVSDISLESRKVESEDEDLNPSSDTPISNKPSNPLPVAPKYSSKTLETSESNPVSSSEESPSCWNVFLGSFKFIWSCTARAFQVICKFVYNGISRLFGGW